MARGCTSVVRPALFAGGLRGAAAAEDICAGQVVLRVPRELLLSAATAERSDLVRRMGLGSGSCQPNTKPSLLA